MVKFWYRRIRGDVSRINEVPALWREDVREMCEKAAQAQSKAES